MRDASKALGKALVARGLVLAAAESCTGGLIAHCLTNIPGSSDWFLGAVVAYANQVKQGVLGVAPAVIADNGAVSRETVEAMTLGVRDLLGADAVLAVSGIAGPGGGSPDKPVGTVWMAWRLGSTVHSRCCHFSGTRLRIKQQTAAKAITGMLEMVTA